MGSGELVRSLMRRELVDDYVLLIHPLVLGSGRRLFADDGALASLRLVDSQTTTTGVVIATYRQAEPAAGEQDRSARAARYDGSLRRPGDQEMKQYLLSIYQPDSGTPPPETLQKVMRDVNALVEESKAAGVWVFNGGLHPPSTATVVRLHEGDVLMTDGPFAEGKEHIGGFLIVKVPDLDAALEWARRTARAITLPIEVRPFQGEVEG